jgi:hypothetical protein
VTPVVPSVTPSVTPVVPSVTPVAAPAGPVAAVASVAPTVAAAPAAAITSADEAPAPITPLPAPVVGATADLGLIGSAAAATPATARELLTTPAGRSVALVLLLMLAILLFLGTHRRLDRGDGKLAPEATAGDVARFR